MTSVFNEVFCAYSAIVIWKTVFELMGKTLVKCEGWKCNFCHNEEVYILLSCFYLPKIPFLPTFFVEHTVFTFFCSPRHPSTDIWVSLLVQKDYYSNVKMELMVCQMLFAQLSEKTSLKTSHVLLFGHFSETLQNCPIMFY